MKINNKIFKKLTSLVLCTTMLGSLVGCTTKKQNKGLVTEEIYSDNFNELDEIKNNDLDYYHSIDPNECTLIMCEPYEYDVRYNVSEFTTRVSSGATWEDVINSINNNQELDLVFKTILIDGLYNLRIKGVEINLDILKYNIDNLKVKHANSIEANGVDAVAEFKANEHAVYINDAEIDKLDYSKVICHEILGHGSMRALINDELYTSTMNIVQKSNNKAILYSILGFTFEEAIADYIAYSAVDKKLDNMTYEGVYAQNLFNFLLICESLDITPNDYIKYGYTTILSRCSDIGSIDALSWLMWLDTKNIFITCKQSDVPFTYEDIICTYFMYLSADDPNMSIDKINRSFDSYKSMIIPCNDGSKDYIATGTTELITIDIESIRTKCIESYNELHNIK